MHRIALLLLITVLRDDATHATSKSGVLELDSLAGVLYAGNVLQTNGFTFAFIDIIKIGFLKSITLLLRSNYFDPMMKL